ncbi:MAG: recombinase family protein [Candidatus Dormibacteria bacterium]
MNSEWHQKVTPEHLQRLAYLYVRQSTLRQVFENTESTKRQYGLRERAVALGWPPDRIIVIDKDLGRSGSDSDREGFQQLVAAVGVGQVGVVLGLEVSRLARSSVDWHRLLEICALTNTLILDEDGLYNPVQFNDRLLLGLKGAMSEAELHVLRARLIGGQLAKASRGELEMSLPVGLVYDPTGKVVFDPDLQVQSVVRSVFETFRRTGSATATVRHFREQGWLVPRRLRCGPHKGEVAWGPLLHHRCLRMLKNPTYAGAFAYGRGRTQRTASGHERQIQLPREQWHTLLLDSHLGYLTWEGYEANLRRLHENAQANGADRRQGPPREGPALLQGLAICGRCGERMSAHYSKRHGQQVPEYVCQRAGIEHGQPKCQWMPGAAIDRAIGELLVATVTPLALEVTLAVQAELDTRAHEADQLRHQQVERARYEAEVAQRRYLRVDPDNRLVADSLEAEWNQKLRALAAAHEEYDRQRQDADLLLGNERRAQILQLATDFPRLWSDPATSQQARKRMVRLLLEDVTLLKADDLTAQVRFRGGSTRTLHLPRPLPAPALRKTDPAIVAEVDGLLDHHTMGEVAAIMAQRGREPSVAAVFTPLVVYHIMRTYGLDDRFIRLRRTGLLTLPEMAATLGAHPQTIKRLAHEGRLAAHPYNDRGACLYEPPLTGLAVRTCRHCGVSFQVDPIHGRRRSCCSPRCCYAAYRQRKRTGQTA